MRSVSFCRAGVGSMTIVDGDDVDESNINRQLPALSSTLGRPKTDVMAERLRDINPSLDLTVLNRFLEPDGVDDVVQQGYDFVIDCIDSITPKLDLIEAAHKAGVKVISSMGAGKF